MGEVEVATAEDDRVCEACQDIADNGPYPIDEAMDLIPNHPGCRCSFTAASEGSLFEDYDPSEPRDPHGRWTSGGGEDIPGHGLSASDLIERHQTSAKSADDIIGAVAGLREKIADVEAKIRRGVPTNEQFKDADGRYTPERAALHDEIVRSMLTPEKIEAATPKEGEKPAAIFLAGRGGSGKSWLTGKSGPVDAGKAIVLNADDVQEHLPGYEGWNAALYHDEAADIVDRAAIIARGAGLNVVIDSTMRTHSSAAAKVAGYEQHGYDVKGYYMFAPPEVAAQRAMGRFAKAGRYVPASYILSSTTNEKSFDNLKDRFSKWAIYDNSGSGGPKLVAEGGK
jgi:predicted ABC-type ATPase